MPNWEDYLSDLGLDKKQPQKPMWGEVIPDMSQMGEQGGSGIMSVIGKLAKIGGMGANLIPGGQVVGVPLTVAGGALEGGDKGGIAGAVQSGMFSGATTLAPMGVNKMIEGFKTPVDTGAMTAYSSKGAPLTVPGVRKAATEVFSSKRSPMTVPSSPKEFNLMGGS